MIRKLFIGLVFSFLVFNSFTQNHVKWNFEYDNITGKFSAEGKIEDGWHVYSKLTKSNAGPIPVRITFEKNPHVSIKGKPEEFGRPIKDFDKNFESMVFFYEHMYVLQTKMKIKKPTTLKGVISYMICNDTMCLPPIDVPFSVEVKP